MNMPKKGFGRKDGSRKGFEQGGRGRNRADNCRHPSIKKSRQK